MQLVVNEISGREVVDCPSLRERRKNAVDKARLSAGMQLEKHEAVAGIDIVLSRAGSIFLCCSPSFETLHNTD